MAKTATAKACKAAAARGEKQCFNPGSQTWIPYCETILSTDLDFSILGFLFKRLTFLAFSWASVHVITPHTEIPECQRFPGLRSKALSYVHPNIHSSSLESVEVCKFKARRVLLPWNDNCEFVFFFFLRGGEAAGNQRLSKSKKWYCHTSRMAVWCLFKRGGKKKKKQSRRLNHIFLPIRPCVPTSIITATCFIFSSAVLSDSHPRAMCCSVRPQIPETWAERSWEILLSCTRDCSQSVLNVCRIYC